MGLTAPVRNDVYVKLRNCAVVHTSRVSNDNSKDKPQPPGNRRRVAQIVHDERGNARVEWIDAGRAGIPLERAPLAIEPTPGRGDVAKLTIERKRTSGFNPYARVESTPPTPAKKPPAKRDLRKLGEWIKLKRELDARKAQDDHDIE
jgi:hypothetical protein